MIQIVVEFVTEQLRFNMVKANFTTRESQKKKAIVVLKETHLVTPHKVLSLPQEDSKTGEQFIETELLIKLSKSSWTSQFFKK